MMGSTPDAAHRKAAREATDWLLLLSEEPQDAELRRRFEAWRDRSPLHGRVWASTLHMSNATQAIRPAHFDEWGSHPREDGNSGDVQRIPGSRTGSRGSAGVLAHVSMRARLAIATVALACLGAIFVPSLLLQLRSDHVTGTAELRKLVLEDGSEVTLAPQSALALAYSAGERRVRLLAGEAFFDVRPYASRPFRVEAGQVQTSVLGTRFDVRRHEDEVTVSVEEGLVEVGDLSRQHPAQRLTKGQSASVSVGGRIATEPKGAEAIAAWRQGLLLSDDEPLGNAIAQLSRYYSGTIIMADWSLAERRVTGVYRLDDPEAALRDIARALDARVRRVAPGILVLSSR